MQSLITSFSKQNKIELSSSYHKLASELDLLSYKLNSAGGVFKMLKTNPKGFYIYGNTGTGKTTLMNSFFETLEVPKLNIHFHDYFIDITRLLTKYTMKELAYKISKKIKVLCFDEFYIESIADAKLLEDLFQKLIEAGVVIVLTSNFKPDDLFKGGFNRHLVFPQFSEFLTGYLNVFNLESMHDFRYKFKTDGTIFTNQIPNDFIPTSLEFNQNIIHGLVKNEEAIFEYKELFSKPRSANQYIFLCRQFDVIYVKNFQAFHINNEDELIRFRNFIDVAYQRHNIIKLEGSIKEEEIFTKEMLGDVKIKRTYSRIFEISSSQFSSKENMKKRVWQKEARIFLETL